MKRLLLLALVLMLSASLKAQLFKKNKLKPIETELSIFLRGPIENGQQQFVVELVTDELFDCANVEIVHEKIVEGDNVTIRLLGLNDPEVCLEALGPAKLGVNLTELTPGNYKFKAVYRNYDPFKATLVVTNETWKLVPEEGPEAMISIRQPVLRRLPPNAVWGKLVYTDKDMAEAVDNFFTDLEAEECRTNGLTPGEYDLFYLRKAGRQDVRDLHGTFEQPFVYLYFGDFDRLKLLVKMYGNKFGEDLRISLYNARGQEAFSWVKD